jgi:hypothetical protein
LLVLALASPVPAEEAGGHYCDDADMWAEWVRLLAKYPDDDEVRAAYALRLGLCQEVKAGTIETSRAVNIFEAFMEKTLMNTERMHRNSSREVET